MIGKKAYRLGQYIIEFLDKFKKPKSMEKQYLFFHLEFWEESALTNKLRQHEVVN